MIIQELAIKNFRCLRELQLTFEPLTALLGRNGVGKSCIIHAIDIFYNTAAQISDEDFYNRDVTKVLCIYSSISEICGN
jgi:putative ATP-dependent endonuclease of OLD family